MLTVIDIIVITLFKVTVFKISLDVSRSHIIATEFFFFYLSQFKCIILAMSAAVGQTILAAVHLQWIYAVSLLFTFSQINRLKKQLAVH